MLDKSTSPYVSKSTLSDSSPLFVIDYRFPYGDRFIKFQQVSFFSVLHHKVFFLSFFSCKYTHQVSLRIQNCIKHYFELKHFAGANVDLSTRPLSLAL